MKEERRIFTRIHFEAIARLKIGHEKIEAKLVDISLKGALFELAAPHDIALHTEGKMRLSFGGKKEEIRAEICVTHVKPLHIGVAINAIDLDSLTHLRRLHELNLGDESLLHREISAMVYGLEKS